MKKIIELLKSNKIVYNIGVIINIIIYNYLFDFITYARLMIIGSGIWLLKNSSYNDIKKLKNKYRGKRCFIIATGPSLTYEDLNLLNREYTIGVNSLVKVIDKLEYTPSYLGIQDVLVYEKIGKMIEHSKLNRIFISDDCFNKVRSNYSKFIKYPIYYSHHCQHGERMRLNTNFSDDVSKIVYDGYSVTYSLLQIAVYLGFNEIYLLGCDCSYNTKGGKQHFVESGHYDKQASTVGERMIYAYSVAKKYLDKYRPDVKVYNATRGGMLEVFPRKTLDEVFPLN